MNILLLTDSHGHSMDAALKSIQPGCKVYTISVGGNIGGIRSMYSARLNEVLTFSPDVIIIHSGHNDVIPHPRYDNHPIYMKFFLPLLDNFRGLLQSNHPLAKVYVSSPFPRTTGPNFTLKQRDSYNKLAIRFRYMLRSAAN